MSKILKQSEIEAILIDIGMNRKNARIGGAIALCEAPAGKSEDGEYQSNFGAVGDQALADETWGYSYGGFQIRSLRAQKGTGDIRDEELLPKIRFNCRSAVAIKRMSGWGMWSTFTSNQYRAYLPDQYPPPPGVYVVKSGDTISEIADDLGVSWLALAEANDLESPYTIYINQYLIIPT